MNIEKNFYNLGPDLSATSGLSNVSPEGQVEADQKPASGEIDEIVDIEQWIRDAKEFIIAMSKGRYNKEGMKTEKELIDEFMAPYLDGKLSFSAFIRNHRTAPLALEITRKIFAKSIDNKESGEMFSTCAKCGQEIVIGSNFCSDCGGKVEKEPDANDYLYREIAASLDSVESRLFGDTLIETEDEFSPDGKKRFSNNALYSISEAFKTADAADRGKIDLWLLKHFEDIKSWGQSYETKGGWRDAISEYAFKNIISQTGNKELSRKTLSFCIDNHRLGYSDVAYLFDKSYSPQLKEGRMGIAGFFAEKLGLDDSILKKWQQSKVCVGRSKKGTEVFVESYAKNLEAARKLEKAQPGCVRRLYNEFGISNFARYDEKMLLRQLETADQDAPYGVVAYPEADHNGAFFQNRSQLGKMERELLKGGYETRVIEVASQLELARRLNGFHKKYGKGGHKIDFLVIGGHGSRNSVQLRENEIVPPISPPPIPPADGKLDENYQKALIKWKEKLKHPVHSREALVSDDIKDGGGRGIRRAADEWFKEGAPVVFVSCSTGVEGGIAQTTAKELGFDTIAPDRPANVESIDVLFDDRGQPMFDVKYAHGSLLNPVRADTMKYAAGGKRE